MNNQHTQQIQHGRRGRAAGIAAASVAAFFATSAVGGAASAAYPADDGPPAKVARAVVDPPSAVSVVSFTVRKPHGTAMDVAEVTAPVRDSSADWYGWQTRAAQSAATIRPRTADFYDHQARAAHAASRDWHTCFRRYESFRSWMAVQIGMPRCDISIGVEQRQ
jgi:hypothetical protein